MEEVRCIFDTCDTATHPTIIVEHGYTGKKCPLCGLIYLSPRPSRSEIQALYHDDQARISADHLITASLVKRLYARHQLRIIRRFRAGGSLLEIGAGAGYFLDEARRVGFDVYGIELNQVQAHFMRSRLHIACEARPFDANSYDGKQFDIIYLCNVLSHLYDPISEFQQMSSRLTERGLLVFETGNLGDVASHYLPLIESFDYPEHLFFFSERTLYELLHRAGLELVGISRYSILPQLLLSRVLTSNRRNHSRTTTTDRPARSPGSASRAKAIVSYLVRYQVGAVFPKGDTPQTVLVVARKRTA